MFLLTDKLTLPIDICCNTSQLSCNHRRKDLKHLYSANTARTQHCQYTTCCGGCCSGFHQGGVVVDL